MKLYTRRPVGFSAFKMFFTFVVLVLFGACSEDGSESLNRESPAFASSEATRGGNANGRSTSNAGDYNINLTVVGDTWTYVITKNAGAKDLSNFSLNFQNCGGLSANINDILWATVNGQPANLQSSNGNNGCNIQSVTTNFVKFDGLPSASTYTIVFKMDRVYGNFVPTTAWLKAGTSCHTYPVYAPCCPL